MTKYKILKADTLATSVEQLEEFSKDNWELVQIIYADKKYYYYFKRNETEIPTKQIVLTTTPTTKKSWLQKLWGS